MNTLRKIGFGLYQNWALLAAALVVILHFAIGLSWWNLLWPVAGMALIIYSVQSPRPFFAPIRMFAWPGIKVELIKRIRGGNPLMAFPAVMYLELEARPIFLEGGWRALQKGLEDHLMGTTERLAEAMRQIGEAFHRSAQSPNGTPIEQLQAETKAPLELVEKTVEHAKKVD